MSLGVTSAKADDLNGCERREQHARRAEVDFYPRHEVTGHAHC